MLRRFAGQKLAKGKCVEFQSPDLPFGRVSEWIAIVARSA